MTITSKETNDRVAFSTPYNAEFIRKARNLAGRWDRENQTWVFPIEVIEDVRKACRDTYGEDDQTAGTPVLQRVRLRIVYESRMDMGGTRDVTIGGRQIARVFDRDGGAKLGEDIVIIKGGFTSGGSRNRPGVRVRDDTTFDMLRLPIMMAKHLLEKFPEHCRIVAPDGSELVGEEPAKVVGGDNVIALPRSEP